MEATKKFWGNEDLMEHLLFMLDLPSIVALASINPVVVSLVQRSPLWTHLLRSHWHLDEMIDLLKKMKDPEPRLLNFLEHICQSYHLEFDCEIKLLIGGKTKVVSPNCFLILEQVVARLKSKVMVVEALESWAYFYRWNVGRAIGRQASRQEQDLDWMRLRWVGFYPYMDRRNLNKCISLLGNCSRWSVWALHIDCLKESEWARLGKDSAKGEIKFVIIRREALIMARAMGRLEDVKKVWVATTSYWRFMDSMIRMEKEEGEAEGWSKIQKILEMGDKEWEEENGNFSGN